MALQSQCRPSEHCRLELAHRCAYDALRARGPPLLCAQPHARCALRIARSARQRSPDLQGIEKRVRIEKRDLLQCLAVGQHLASICSVMQLDEEPYTCVQSTHEHSVRGLRWEDGSASIPDVRKPSPGETWAGNSTSARSANATAKKWNIHIFEEYSAPVAATRQESRGSDQQPKEACAGSGRTEETSTERRHGRLRTVGGL